jgi:hypothetical protein
VGLHAESASLRRPMTGYGPRGNPGGEVSGALHTPLRGWVSDVLRASGSGRRVRLGQVHGLISEGRGIAQTLRRDIELPSALATARASERVAAPILRVKRLGFKGLAGHSDRLRGSSHRTPTSIASVPDGRPTKLGLLRIGATVLPDVAGRPMGQVAFADIACTERLPGGVGVRAGTSVWTCGGFGLEYG